MHCLVTGEAGFIGGHLVRRLAARKGDRIRVFDNLSRSPAGMTNIDGVEFINGDLRNVTAVRRAVVGCQTVIHLAAQATVMGCEESPVEAHEVNVTGTYNLLRLAREAGVRRFVMA